MRLRERLDATAQRFSVLLIRKRVQRSQLGTHFVDLPGRSRESEKANMAQQILMRLEERSEFELSDLADMFVLLPLNTANSILSNGQWPALCGQSVFVYCPLANASPFEQAL